MGENDYALLSFVGYVDGEEYEGNRVDKYLYEMSMGSMPIEFDEQLTGTMAGGEAHIEFVIPPSSSVPDFVGKTATFDVTVHEIKAQNLPEVDDDFAMQVGGFESLDELKDTLRERVAREKAVAHEQAKEMAVRRALAERLEGDIPEVMVGTRAESMMRDFVNGLESRGMTMEQYLEFSGVSDEVIANDITGQAQQSVREDLALEALFRALDLGIDDQDVDDELELVASATKKDKDEARTQWEEMGLMPVIREQIMHRKAVNWLLENATIEIAEPDAAETAAAEGTKTEAAKKSRSKGRAKAKVAKGEPEPGAEPAAEVEADEAVAEQEESEV